ncbi:MAG: phosphatase PAP2 family protein [Candidatus Omnitrophica bacterium]|nr:phosphatase PAP2 family protein [Candidatus Omnitrophota bacterium]
MPFISFLGGPEFLFTTGAVSLALRKKETRRLGILLIAGLAASLVVVNILKISVARPRPFLALAQVHILAREGGFSFPSGHATNAFMAATLLSAYSKKYRYFYILAFLVAFSRIYLGVHYPSDVIAGALLGAALGYILGTANKKFHIVSDSERKGA